MGFVVLRHNRFRVPSSVMYPGVILWVSIAVLASALTLGLVGSGLGEWVNTGTLGPDGPFAVNDRIVGRGSLVTLQSLTDAAFDYGDKGFHIAFGLVASMVLFLGLMKIGESYFVPNSSTLVSTFETSFSRRGRSWNFRNPSRFARSVTSSSMPDAM